MNPEPRLVEVRKNVLRQNDVVARALRDRFRAAGVFVVSLVSSPGSGKTAFLEKTLTCFVPTIGLRRWWATLPPKTMPNDWREARLQ